MPESRDEALAMPRTGDAGHAVDASDAAGEASPGAERRDRGGRRRGTGDAAPEPARRPARTVRKARLRLVQVEPWSVMKVSFLLSVALGIVIVVAVGIVWTVLGVAGLWDSVNTIVHDTIGDTTTKPFEIQDYVGTSRVLGFAMIVAVADVVLMTVIATLSAFLYNMAATLLGGIEVTFAEDR